MAGQVNGRRGGRGARRRGGGGGGTNHRCRINVETGWREAERTCYFTAGICGKFSVESPLPNKLRLKAQLNLQFVWETTHHKGWFQYGGWRFCWAQLNKVHKDPFVFLFVLLILLFVLMVFESFPQQGFLVSHWAQRLPTINGCFPDLNRRPPRASQADGKVTRPPPSTACIKSPFKRLGIIRKFIGFQYRHKHCSQYRRKII